MSLDAILAAIEEEASGTVDALLSDARKRAAAATSTAATRADAERLRLSASRDAAAELAASRTINQARLTADRALRAAQEGLYQTALDRARVRLAKVRATPGYERIFRTLLTEAQAALTDADTVSIDPRDRALAAAALEETHTEAAIDASLETWGGVEVRTTDGRVVKNTLEARLYKADPALRQIAVSMCPELVRGM